jgi:hypothetical protein
MYILDVARNYHDFLTLYLVLLILRSSYVILQVLLRMRAILSWFKAYHTGDSIDATASVVATA